jgi:integrase
MTARSDGKRAASAEPKQGKATGLWGFVVDADPGPDGERRQVRRKGFRTKREAQEALDKVRGQARTASYVPPAKMTVKAYLTGWLAGLPATGLRPSTVDGYRRNMDYVIDVLGGRRLDSLTPHDLDKLYASLLESGKRQSEGGLSPRSVRYVHGVLRKALADALRKGTLARNVADLADAPRPRDARAPEMAWWTPKELRTFLDLTAGEPLGPLFRVAAMTGMRRGEACGLRWQDVDLDKARLTVRQQLIVVRSPGAPDGGLRFSEPKTSHGHRRIDLDPETVAVLKAQRRRQAEQRLVMGAGWRDKRDLVFTEEDGRPLDPESVAQVFNRRVARSKLPRIRFHDLRHSHVAHLIAAGESPLLIAKRLGHHSAAFSLDKYGHLFEQAGSQAASAVAAMVDGR